MTTLASTLQAFFTDRLAKQKNASPHTVAAYRDALRLLLMFATSQIGTTPARLRLEDIDAPLVGAFLSWQTFKDGEEVITAQEVQFTQQAELIQLHTITRGISVEGELRLWDNEILMGWYAANDGSVRSKGTMYFVLHPHGMNMIGRWVGLSYDGAIVTGWGGVARTEDDARALIRELNDRSDHDNG